MVPQPLAVTTSIAREIMPADHLILVCIVMSSSLLGGETGLPVGLNGSPVKGDPGGWIREQPSTSRGNVRPGLPGGDVGSDGFPIRRPAIGDGRGRLETSREQCHDRALVGIETMERL